MSRTNHFPSRWIVPALFAVSLLRAGWLPAQEEKGADRWEKTIAKFEEGDRSEPPPRDAVLFIGSSSIRGWKLEKYFPDRKVINRGFGGSHIADSVQFTERIVWPYEPKTIVLYAGDNDVASGKTPDRVLRDFREFVGKTHRKLPRARILFISIKPSIKRWNLAGPMRAANALIRKEAARDKRVEYVDVFAPMLNDEGTPRKELFAKDGLHLNHEGYLLWTKTLLPLLD
ncbi:MAG: SGNH/GDSL hydrolase family protein [Planctomycetales bacterium]